MDKNSLRHISSEVHQVCESPLGELHLVVHTGAGLFSLLEEIQDDGLIVGNLLDLQVQ